MPLLSSEVRTLKSSVPPNLKMHTEEMHVTADNNIIQMRNAQSQYLKQVYSFPFLVKAHDLKGEYLTVSGDRNK